MKRKPIEEAQLATHRIAVIGGDGIGPEVIEAGCQVLDALMQAEPGLDIQFQRYDWGSDYYRKHGVMMPPDGVAQVAKHDAIFFGAVGDKDLPDDITLWGLRLAICQGLDQYANVRPARLPAGPHRPPAPGPRRQDRLGHRPRELRG